MSQSTCTVHVPLPSPLQLRRAGPSDAAALSALCRAAKGHWGYPAEWLEAWTDVLRLTPRLVREQEIFIAMRATDAARVGFFGFRRAAPLWHLEHFWLAPEQIGRGWGRAMFAAAVTQARRRGIARLHIKSDPHAEGFYRRMGARRIGEERYVLLGKFPRELPLLTFDVPRAS